MLSKRAKDLEELQKRIKKLETAFLELVKVASESSKGSYERDHEIMQSLNTLYKHVGLLMNVKVEEIKRKHEQLKKKFENVPSYIA